MLLDQLARQPDATVWDELEGRLVVAGERCCSAGFAALPEVSRLARSDTDDHRDRALDFTDEHYHLSCPHCAARLAIVIGDYGHYSAIRDHNDGDIHRVPFYPARPEGRAFYRRRLTEGKTTMEAL